MSEVPSTYREPRTVESFDVDRKGKLKPQVLFSFLTNCAWKHTSLTDHGFESVSARNQMWVLAKFQLVISQLPSWGSKIVIETWGKGTQRLYALRDFVVSSENGSKLASATSAWLMLDKASRRPVRVDQMVFPWIPGRNELQTEVGKVPGLTDGRTRARYRAAFSDLDPNGHVTAMRYVQWIMDSNTRAVLEESWPSHLEISFLAEAALEDEVTVLSESKDGRELYSVRREGDQKELCRARIQWSSTSPPRS